MAVRLAYNVPNTTHRYLISPLSSAHHLKVMLTSRYVNFVKSLQTSTKYVVRVLLSICVNDLRTVMGRTLSTLARLCECNVSALSASAVKSTLEYFPVPVGEEGRVQILKELKNHEVEVPGFSSEELREITEYVCTS